MKYYQIFDIDMVTILTLRISCDHNYTVMFIQRDMNVS